MFWIDLNQQSGSTSLVCVECREIRSLSFANLDNFDRTVLIPDCPPQEYGAQIRTPMKPLKGKKMLLSRLKRGWDVPSGLHSDFLTAQNQCSDMPFCTKLL